MHLHENMHMHSVLVVIVSEIFPVPAQVQIPVNIVTVNVEIGQPLATAKIRGHIMDINFLRPLQVSVDVAYANWSKEPTRLSYMRNLRQALDILTDATIDQLLNGTGDTTTDKKTSDCLCTACAGLNAIGPREPKCKNCSDTGWVSVPITHPTNPNLDSWDRHICYCKNGPPKVLCCGRTSVYDPCEVKNPKPV